MKSVLLIPATTAAFLHTPRTVALLQDAGFDVTLVCDDESFNEYARVATGKECAPWVDSFLGYDVMLMAPYSPEYSVPGTDGKLIVAPFIAKGKRMPKCPKGAVLVAPPAEDCSMGMLGYGRVATPEQCVEAVITALTPQDYAGKTILLTAGPTIEDADPARFVSNRSTGRMGTAIAAMAARRGAKVILVHGPMQAAVPPVPNVMPVPVRSAAQMCDAVLKHIDKADIAILCAAVADFAPETYSEAKIKKGKSQEFSLKMHCTPDILATVGALKQKPFLVGFAAESNDIVENASGKMERKNCDMLCANDILAPGCGFATNTNRLLVFRRGGSCTEIPLASKSEVADRLLDMIISAIK